MKHRFKVALIAFQATALMGINYNEQVTIDDGNSGQDDLIVSGDASVGGDLSVGGSLSVNGSTVWDDSNTGSVARDEDYVNPLNPFNAIQFHNPLLTNFLYGMDKRGSVTVSGYLSPTTPIADLFDSYPRDHDNTVGIIPDGETATFLIEFPRVTYGKGMIVISTAYGRHADSISVKVLQDLDLNGVAETEVLIAESNDTYFPSSSTWRYHLFPVTGNTPHTVGIEVSVTGADNSGNGTRVTEIEYHRPRAGRGRYDELPLVTKYGNQTLIYDLVLNNSSQLETIRLEAETGIISATEFVSSTGFSSNTAAIGSNLALSSDDSLSVGQYNLGETYETSWKGIPSNNSPVLGQPAGHDPIFEVGTGDPLEARSAFTVYRNGSIELGQTKSLGVESRSTSLVRTMNAFEWVGDIYSHATVSSHGADEVTYLYIGEEDSMLWGYFDVTVVSDGWGGASTAKQGGITKRFCIAYSTANHSKDFYQPTLTQKSEIISAVGPIVENVRIGELEKDPVSGEPRVPIYIGYGSRVFLGVKMEGHFVELYNQEGYPHLTDSAPYGGGVEPEYGSKKLDHLDVQDVEVSGSIHLAQAAGDISMGVFGSN